MFRESIEKAPLEGAEEIFHRLSLQTSPRPRETSLLIPGRKVPGGQNLWARQTALASRWAAYDRAPYGRAAEAGDFGSGGARRVKGGAATVERLSSEDRTSSLKKLKSLRPYRPGGD